jgi:hypothetical protein
MALTKRWALRMPHTAAPGGNAMHTSYTSASIVTRTARQLAGGVLLTVLVSAAASSQTLPPVATTADLSGPRFGLTLLSDGVVQELAKRDIEIGPHISQFGWQFERQFFARGGPVTMVTEWVALVGGLEQSVALPSLSWMVGVRTHDGAEFGIGPNITPAGTALVLATGMTFRASAINVPVNVAVVPSRVGTRVTLLTGFSLRQR